MQLKILSMVGVMSAMLLTSQDINAQGLVTPRPSQLNVITQTLGLSEISVAYSRPSVNNREIWGKLVPYGQVWRAGANENTTISFSTNAKVGGQAIKAGTYGLHIIPNETGEWTVIFSNNSSSWGSFFYNQEEDAARVNVQVRETPTREILTFDFIDVQNGSAELILNWEKIEIPVKIEIDVHDLVLASFKDQLRSTAGFAWNGWNQAANYCLTNDVDLEQGILWVDRSIRAQENFTNNFTKSQLLEKMGKTTEAQEILERGLATGTAIELHNYARNLIGQDKKADALDVFKRNAKDNPDIWFVSVGLARGYQALNDNKNAIKYWKKGIELAPEAQKSFYENILAQLEKSN